jgi:hypothetical protein
MLFSGCGDMKTFPPFWAPPPGRVTIGPKFEAGSIYFQILEDLRTQRSISVLDFIVHLSHYMFRPRLAAIFR